MQSTKLIGIIILLMVFTISCNDEIVSNQPEDLLSLPDSVDTYAGGLVGAWYHGSDLTRIGTSSYIENLDVNWTTLNSHGNDWSAQWFGHIISPITGEVSFHVNTNKGLILNIANELALDVGIENDIHQGSITLIEGKKYSLHAIYSQQTGGEAWFNVEWSWAGHDKVIIPNEAFGFSSEEADWWNYTPIIDPESVDLSQFYTIPVQNGIAYSSPGRYAGWPANNGVWQWGNEILVGFSLGYYNPNSTGGHEIDGSRPEICALGRSLDGGDTWQTEIPTNYFNTSADASSNFRYSPGFDFSNPDFTMRFGNNKYFASQDRGKTWDGPFRVVVTGTQESVRDLTSRTDYIILDASSCLAFFSCNTGLVESNYQDRSYCAMSTDGGKTFQFQGWMTQNTEARSVMSSTVKITENHLVSVMRRKYSQSSGDDRPSFTRNWIEAAESFDNGVTWINLGEVARTDLGERNGNPPALVKLNDGRLCVAYAYRDYPYSIRAKISSDNGHSWGEEMVLRMDGKSWDLGYTRMVVRPDGKVVVMYYYTTEELPEQHIGVTIFDPSGL